MARRRPESRFQIDRSQVQYFDRAFGFVDGGFGSDTTWIDGTDPNQFWMLRYKARDPVVVTRNGRSVAADHDGKSDSSAPNLVDVAILGLRSNEMLGIF